MKKIAVEKQQSASAYLHTAPEALILHHRVIGPGKEILGRLLTNRRMEKPWAIISSHVKVQIYSPTGQPYRKDSPNDPHRRFWSQIVSIISKSREPEKSLADLDDDLEKIEHFAKGLRNLIIDPARTDRPRSRAAAPKTGARFDYLPLYEYFPAAVMKLNMQDIPLPDDAWEQADNMRRGYIARNLMSSWPSLSGVLDELIESIRQERKNEKERARPVKRDRKTKGGESNRSRRFFVVCLTQYLERDLRLTRDDAIAVTEAIASSIYKMRGAKTFVADAMRSN